MDVNHRKLNTEQNGIVIVDILQLLPPDGMDERLFDLCIDAEQKLMMEGMIGTTLQTVNGKIQVISDAVRGLAEPRWENTKIFVAAVFCELTKKAEEWAEGDSNRNDCFTSMANTFEFTELSKAIGDVEEAKGRTSENDILIHIAKLFCKEHCSEESNLQGDTKLQGAALLFTLKGISERNKRSVEQNNKRLYHKTIGHQLCCVLKNAARMQDIPIREKYALYEALAEYYVQTDNGVAALQSAAMYLSLIDKAGIEYWRNVYAHTLLLEVYKTVCGDNNDISAREYAGLYHLLNAASSSTQEWFVDG